MGFYTKIIDDIEVRYSRKDKFYKDFIILVYGGGLKQGKEKFFEWQNEFLKHDIGSISFDFPGMGESSGNVKKNTLEDRIKITSKIVDWTSSNFKYDKLSIYGCSMGGYVVLGVANNKKCLDGKIIIHVSAAYPRKSNRLAFDENFTRELKLTNAWKDSFSFEWLSKLDKKILMIIHEEDGVIPEEISTAYNEILSKKKDSKYIEIPRAPHSVWGDGEVNRAYRLDIVNKIIDFIQN